MDLIEQLGQMNTDKKKVTNFGTSVMASRKCTPIFPFIPYFQILSVFIYVFLCFLPVPACAQEVAAQEVAVNLVEGRVVVCAAKDGIVVATADAHSEPGSRQPVVVMLSALRAGVLLGAVEWIQPESSDKPVRLDGELPRIAATALNTSGRPNYSNAATDIESIGVALLERVREIAGQLHNKININENEPLIRLVLIDYLPNYGPEAWTIDYHIRQDALANDYWRTRVLRPSYNQLYPPEKGQPHTLVEVRYPPANRATAAPELLDLLRQNDPRLARIRTANEILAKSVAFVAGGESQKSVSASDAEFLRAALPAVTPPETKLTMAIVDFDKGFQSLIQAPEGAAATPADMTPREPDAPTLRHKPSQ
jgi:hypothetical protein